MYQLYKPLRNKLSKINLESGLQAMWIYREHLLNGRAVPQALAGPPGFRKHLYLHQLATLTRELILNAEVKGGKPFTYKTLAESFNLIRDIQGFISSRETDDPDRVLLDLHSIIHHQIPLNNPSLHMPAIIRNSMIFGDDKINEMLKRTTGLDFIQFLFFALQVSGGVIRHPYVSAHDDYSEFGISEEDRDLFFSKMSQSIDNLRTSSKALARYDHNWEYTVHALLSKPFVWLSNERPWELYCPTPSFVWSRLGSGLYYDLVKEPDFGNVFGDSFEAYVGKYAKSVLPSDRFIVLKERPYHVGLDLKHGTDWIISDKTGHLFIECKTKRLNHNAKLLDAEQPILNELTILADAALQIYKNLDDALSGLTDLDAGGLTCYPMIVTLEDWVIFSPAIRAQFNDLLKLAMIDNEKLLNLSARYPVTIASCQEFEELLIVIRSCGIEKFFKARSHPDFDNWMLSAFMQSAFPTIQRMDREVVSAKWRELLVRFTARWEPQHQKSLLEIPVF